MAERHLAISHEPTTAPSIDVWMASLGSLPWMAQPGERWLYETASDVLGVLIERVADQPLEAFLQERLFAPLGMVDTAFHVPAAKRHRLPPCYQGNDKSGALDLFDPPHGYWSRPPAFPAGSNGLVSTVDDFLAFGQMLLNHGRYQGERILSRPAVALMTSAHLTPPQQADASAFLGEKRNWGFGLAVVTGRDELAATPGRFGWDGGYGTAWATDPQEELVAILMTQLCFPRVTPVYQDFWTLVYQALDD
ncbi:MAG: beta-lactamase family protein [Caldilineaceae bacterium]|nr:beta-lactamase family protein [Caldilineaceae bacterium]